MLKNSDNCKRCDLLREYDSLYPYYDQETGKYDEEVIGQLIEVEKQMNYAPFHTCGRVYDDLDTDEHYHGEEVPVDDEIPF